MTNQKRIVIKITTRDIGPESDYSNYFFDIGLDGKKTAFLDRDKIYFPKENDFIAESIPQFNGNHASLCYNKNSGLIYLNTDYNSNISFFAKSPRIRSSSRRDFNGRVITDTVDILGQKLNFVESVICINWIIKNIFSQSYDSDRIYCEPIFIDQKPNIDFQILEELAYNLSRQTKLIEENLRKEHQRETLEFLDYSIIGLLPPPEKMLYSKPIKSNFSYQEEKPADSFLDMFSFSKLEDLPKIFENTFKDALSSFSFRQKNKDNHKCQLIRTNSSKILSILNEEKNKEKVFRILKQRDYQKEKILLLWNCDIEDSEQIAILSNINSSEHSFTSIVHIDL